MTTLPYVEHSMAPVDREVALLEMLRRLLDTVLRLADDEDLSALPQVCEQVKQTAQDLIALSLQLGRAGIQLESARRRDLLSEVSRRRVLCRVLLRQWRRRLAVRHSPLGYPQGISSYGASTGGE